MDPYDSDSSIDEDFTDTGVLLGYAAEEVIEDTVSHLGGWPKWLADNTPPPGEFANCKVCNSPMLLLLELHGDLPDHFPTDERRLYIFGCPRKPCNRKPGSVRAYRATRKVNLNATKEYEEEGTKEIEKKAAAPAPPPPQKPKDLGASLFGATSLTSSVSANANPFSSNPGSSAGFVNPFAMPKPSIILASASAPTPAPTPAQSSTNALAESFADKVRISSPEPSASNPTITAFKPTPESQGALAPWPEQSAFPAPYQNYFLDAEYETLSRPSTPTVPDNVQMEPMEEDGGAGDVDLKDTFESDLDKAFMKFSTRLSHNPEQVLRYEYRGSPLLYSYADEVGKRLHPEHSAGRVATIGGGHMPRCEYCGAQRVFEVQLVPHAISILEDGRPGVGLGKDDAGMEWGTIVMGVCAKDCAPEALWQTGWREEWAGVQWEEIK
ncbi:hypothetical protein N7520_008533 [Penicillium odoratum]|uniref:uncharacterized protein n=1 Tax=Penicillium odoratum TaxID=1167516 RepID=UPI0025467DE8|nr:uncharacterized protein N7520_008533 [Penicillium odoratum]KAJ5751616.1 hypothetical protein N7520_008533 [Penicillium odoratum]